MNAAIGGGSTNKATDDFSAVAGGRDNQAGDAVGTTTDRAYAFVGGGQLNRATGLRATIVGGFDNIASGANSNIAGGTLNQATGQRASILGGISNLASGEEAIASGKRAKATHNGTFVWAEQQQLRLPLDRGQAVLRAGHRRRALRLRHRRSGRPERGC